MTRSPCPPAALCALLLLTAALLAPRGAHAQTDPRRDPSYFRGRTAAGNPDDALLFVPRVLLLPLHLVSEFGLRRPIVGLVAWGENNHVLPIVERVFNPTPDFSWSPSLQLDFGLASMVGAGFTWRNAGVHGNELRVVGSTGGPDYIDVAARERVSVGNFRFGVRGAYFDRPDQLFYGLGNGTRADDQARYRLRRREVLGLFDWLPSVHATFELAGGYRDDLTAPGVDVALDPQRFGGEAGVPGFGQQLQLAYGTLDVALDSRRSALDYSGIRVEAHVTGALDTLNQQRAFVVSEGSVEVGVEVLHPGRVLVASVYVADSQPLGAEPVPFQYLPHLGRAILPGFRWGRFVGESAVVAGLDYHYPIWSHLDALWTASTGNVYGRHFDGFDAARMASSLGFGLRTRAERAPTFEAIIAVGTSRFDEPFALESVRLFLGVNRGL